MPEQAALPLAEAVKPPAGRFVIPDDPVVVAPPEVAAPVETTEQNTGDEATPATPEAKPETEVTPEQEAKRAGRRFERKLDKAYRQRAEAQARAELAEKQLAEARQQTAPAKEPEGKPRLEDFEYDPVKHSEAVEKWARAEEKKEFESKQRTEAQTKAHQKLVSGWEEKAERGADKYDDWNEKVGVIQPTVPAFAALMEADNAEEIAYYLGSNPKEAQRIIQLPPMSQIREIGKIEAKLLSEPEKPKTPSKAPAPITPLTGTATISTAAPSEQDDTATWIKKRQKQVHGKR